MPFSEGLRRSAAWSKHHAAEIVLAVAFALLFGWPLARLIDPPKPELKIVVLAAHDTRAETIEAFKKAIHDEHQLTIGAAPVDLELQQLAGSTADDVETAVNKATELVGNGNVVMVIAQLKSSQVEASLPVFFSARPRVPVITTVASDDDLLVTCNTGAKGNPVMPLCADNSNFVPLLQLSPTNRDQGRWAIAYAAEHRKRKFMIVYDNSTNKSYIDNLRDAYQAAVEEFNADEPNDHAELVGTFPINRLPTEEDFATGKPDCILYAGGIGNVRRLLARVPKSSLPMMVILSDSAVNQNIPVHEFGTQVQPINFTYQTDEYDYNHHTNAFSQDSIAIASELIADVNQRGLGLGYRLKSLFGFETAEDARRALIDVMKQNASFRTSYEGASEPGVEGLAHPIYVFEGHKRVNGIYHVLQLEESPRATSTQMADVDNWHPKRELTASEAATKTTSPGTSKTLIAKHVDQP